MSPSLRSTALVLACALCAAPSPAQLGAQHPASLAERITRELTRPNDDPIGRPLPIAGHWNTGFPSSGHSGWDPEFVMDYFDSGEFVVPGFYLRMKTQAPEPWSHYAAGLKRARQARLPICIRFTQWDRPFRDDPAYFGLPPADNPNVIDASDGVTIVPITDPEGPLARWIEVGIEWGQLPRVHEIQAAYPDPPLVIWINNFEHPRLQWQDAESSWRFVQNHGNATSGEEKRRILGDGWIERDAALFEALRSQLSPAWQAVSIPVCYSAFGRRKYGLWNGWDRRSLHVPGRFAPWPLAVSGSPSYYVFGDNAIHPETDYRVDGPQISGMNWQFMLAEALRDDPDYFWEVSVYDGSAQRHEWYRDLGQVYDPARYLGYVRFALWSCRPRVLREFRLAHEDREEYVPYWEVTLAAVREVHENLALQRFYRKGELVVNPLHPHPFQKNLYPGYTDLEVERNFQLEVDVNPPRPWTGATELDVFALALVLGARPQREWLLYAYAPLADFDDARITVPGYGDVLVDVPRGEGVFVFLGE